MDWLGNRCGRYIFRYVDFLTMGEGAEYPDVSGGTLELSALTDTKASGSIDYEGTMPDASKLMRIYYTFTDDDGETLPPMALATVAVEVSTPTVIEDANRGEIVRGSATLDGVLRILKDKEYGAPFTIAAGTNCIQKAVELVRSVGLQVDTPNQSDYTLNTAHTFAAEDANYLTIVNWLLTTAGFAAATPDAYGVIQMARYVEPTERDAVFTFNAGQKSVILPDVPYTTDWALTPNVCRLYFETETESVSAWAANIDPNHPASLPSRAGREKTLRETVTEIEGANPSEIAANLESKARSTIVSQSAGVEYVEIGCPLLPIAPNDAIGVDYGNVRNWRGAITNYTISLKNDDECKVKARRFVRNTLEIESGSEVIWSA